MGLQPVPLIQKAFPIFVFLLLCIFSIYASVQMKRTKLRVILKMWVHSSTVLLLSYFWFFLLFPNIA